MIYFKRGVKSLMRATLKPSIMRAISRLCADINGDVRLLGATLQEASRNELSIQEKSWIDSIEALRKELCNSQTKIDLVDFGAGSKNLSLSEENKQLSRKITRSVGDICKNASKPYFEALILFKLIRKFKPTNSVELGTCLGISASFEAAALTLNNAGKLVTLEGAESLAALAAGHFDQLGLANVKVVVGKFQDTLADVLKSNQPVDYIFVDGHHDEKATIEYFEIIKPYLAKKSLVIFDDISWSQGMKNAWNIIKADSRVNISLDLKQMGICILDQDSSTRKYLRIPFW